MKFKCPKHPEYKALRKPTAKCGMCYILWRQAERDREQNGKEDSERNDTSD